MHERIFEWMLEVFIDSQVEGKFKDKKIVSFGRLTLKISKKINDQ